MSRPPSQAARGRALRAAGELLVEGGLDAISIEAVSRRSGVAKTTLYRHFGGIDGLVFEGAAASVTIVSAPDTGTLIGDLREIQRRYLKIASSGLNRSVFGWMLTRALSSPDAAAMFKRARVQPQGSTLIALQRAIARGEIPATTNLDLAMHLIQGPLISKRIVDNTELSETESEQLLTMIIHALQ